MAIMLAARMFSALLFINFIYICGVITYSWTIVPYLIVDSPLTEEYPFISWTSPYSISQLAIYIFSTENTEQSIIRSIKSMINGGTVTPPSTPSIKRELNSPDTPYKGHSRKAFKEHKEITGRIVISLDSSESEDDLKPQLVPSTSIAISSILPFIKVLILLGDESDLPSLNDITQQVAQVKTAQHQKPSKSRSSEFSCRGSINHHFL